MITVNDIIGSLVYMTGEALNKDSRFMNIARTYHFAPQFVVDGRIRLWHYPGTQEEISEVLMSIKGHPNSRSLKYPSLLNFQPVDENVRQNDITARLNLAFIAPVKSEWRTQHREVEAFKKVLIPVYEEFLRQIKHSGYFRLDYGDIPHTRRNVFTTGKAMNKKIEGMYGDYIDALEIQGLSLRLKQCYSDAVIAKIETENSLVTEGINEFLNN
jgi:hypothetical protein